MKLSRISSSLLCAGMALFLASCGSGGNEKTATADSTAAADSAAKAQAANTIVTTPQNVVVITHKVANYAKWVAAYDAHDSARLANGLHNYVIGRGLEDSNMVIVVLKADDTAKAKAFEKDPGLKVAMKKGGVLGAPTMSMFTETWQDTAKVETNLRAATMFTVKDWDAFVKAFEQGKQARADNGIAARVLGHDLDDNKKASVVAAILDSAKAFAYYRSDEFKHVRDTAGVVSEPSRFVFRIIKTY
ncbi:MAG TPA: hypothetical protein VHE54_11175 [Puia sp.]|nr:hypothetical protein [Puia sp.]